MKLWFCSYALSWVSCCLATAEKSSVWQYWNNPKLLLSWTMASRSQLCIEEVMHFKTLMHITSVLDDLHWLPVSQRVVFKTALMVWKCVHGVAPAYLNDLCIPATAISGRQHLRSAATGTLLVPCTGTATALNGPATWNCLPPALRFPGLSESTFKWA